MVWACNFLWDISYTHLNLHCHFTELMKHSLKKYTHNQHSKIVFPNLQPSENQTDRYSNGHFPDTICLRFSNGKIDHLVLTPVFRPQYTSKANWPFENRTSFVWYSDVVWRPNHLTLGHKSTIWIPDYSQILITGPR